MPVVVENLACLVPAMREAGDAIMQIKQKGVSARYKADASPVTQADMAAEAILTAALSKYFPDIPVISEENTQSHNTAPSACYFLVDPLDGTREFIRADSKGAFTVNIGLIEGGRATGGLVFAPALDWLCWTQSPLKAVQIRAGRQSSLSVRQLPETGPVALASRSHRDPKTDAFLEMHHIKQTIATGSSLKFIYLAAGEADIYPRFGPTMEWDTAAGEAILSAAGGAVFDTEGKAHHYGKAGWKNGPFIACAGFQPQARESKP